MTEENNITENDLLFVSWTNRDGLGKELGDAFTKFFSNFDLGIEVFYSDRDLAHDWYHELNENLKKAKFGVFCITPKAVNSEWVNYELGSILNNGVQPCKDVKCRVFPIQLSNNELINRDKTPFAHNNVKKFDKKEFEALIECLLNEYISKNNISASQALAKQKIVYSVFQSAFKTFQTKVKKVLKKEKPEEVKANISDEVQKTIDELRKKSSDYEQEITQLLKKKSIVEEENKRLRSVSQQWQTKVKQLEDRKVISSKLLRFESPYPFNMIFVKGGTFQLENHIVTLNDYYIGETQVTQGLWKAVMNGNNPSYFKEGDNYPVERVSWNDIVNDFLPRLNKMTGREFCLPSEAEWEYAAGWRKDGERNTFSGCNDKCELGKYAWYSDNSSKGTHRVISKPPNDLGIYDMSGNVWEWCQDWYNASSRARVLRGGAWNNYAQYCRVSYRNWDNPNSSSRDFGFRLSLSLPKKEEKEK